MTSIVEHRSYFSLVIMEALMNRFGMIALTGFCSIVAISHISYAQITHTGIIERVWEDGFRLNIGDRTLTVDSWDLYGDHTPRHLSVGDRITLVGERSGRDFDAFSITILESAQPNPGLSPSASGFANGDSMLTGVIERVWEDGFRLNTGDRIITVDSWDVYGDHTVRHLSVGDRVTVAGEFSRGEFDATRITIMD
jgi:hypothetical protein